MSLLDYEAITLNGYVKFNNRDELIKGYINLHFKGFFNYDKTILKELITELVDKIQQFQQEDGSYNVPAGVRIFKGTII